MLSIGEACTNYNADKQARYAGTSAVVQDMMHYTELAAKAKGQPAKEAKINYFGISYGTILGQTLAAMYPQRLNRIILDSNAYGVANYDGLDINQIDDRDHSWKFFFNFCAKAGKDLCPFASNATNGIEVEERFRALLDKLEREPVIRRGQKMAGIVTRGSFMQFSTQHLYGPKTALGYVTIAYAAAGLEKGSTAMIDGWQATTPPQLESESLESLILIRSIDAAGRYPLKTYAEFEAMVSKLQEVSSYGWRDTAVGNAILASGM